jgi:hypothetical protein
VRFQPKRRHPWHLAAGPISGVGAAARQVFAKDHLTIDFDTP